MNKTSNLAKGGILTALGILFNYSSVLFPTSRFFLLGVASSLVPIALMLTGIRNACIVYAATSLLSILLLGFKVNVILYIVFFGIYGFIKYTIEKLKVLPIEILLKLVFFNTCIGITYIITKFLFLDLSKVKFPIIVVFVAAQLVFLLYDYALSLFISYIDKGFIRKLKK